MLTRCTRNPPSVATESGSDVSLTAFGEAEEAPEEKPARRLDPDTGATEAGADMRAEAEAAVELGGEDGVRTAAPAFWLTIICSPCFSPRLESGSSGTMVSDRGG